MSPQQNEKYRAYIKATVTVAKTRQVVMLYDGIIRFMKQAADAIREKRIEDRYNLTAKSSEIITGLQSSIDFEKGGDIAKLLHGFYTHLSRRVILLNFIKDPVECEQKCAEIIEDIRQMREVWDTIDQNLSGTSSEGTVAAATISSGSHNTKPPSDNGIILSA